MEYLQYYLGSGTHHGVFTIYLGSGTNRGVFTILPRKWNLSWNVYNIT